MRLSETQSIVGFPKFGTVGIGFAQEEDWNTNLPYTCGTEEIYEHIDHNKGDDSITREDCIAAIRMIQDRATADRAPKPAAPEVFRCSKSFDHPDGDRATELLLIRHPDDAAWDVKPRCPRHPADDEIPLLHKLNPSLICSVVPLDGAR